MQIYIYMYIYQGSLFPLFEFGISRASIVNQCTVVNWEGQHSAWVFIEKNSVNKPHIGQLRRPGQNVSMFPSKVKLLQPPATWYPPLFFCQGTWTTLGLPPQWTQPGTSQILQMCLVQTGSSNNRQLSGSFSSETSAPGSPGNYLYIGLSIELLL